jgi:hypothetical protein
MNQEINHEKAQRIRTDQTFDHFNYRVGLYPVFFGIGQHQSGSDTQGG